MSMLTVLLLVLGFFAVFHASDFDFRGIGSYSGGERGVSSFGFASAEDAEGEEDDDDAEYDDYAEDDEEGGAEGTGQGEGQEGAQLDRETIEYIMKVVSDDCAAEMKALRVPKKEAEAKKCEQDNKFDDQVINHLKTAKQEDAVKVTQQAFQKCGAVSEKCAAQVAPGVVRKLRFAGMALTDDCRSKVKSQRDDPKLMKEVRKCEAKEKVAQHLLMALRQRDLDGSVKAAETGFKKCMKLSDQCAFQVAPVLVNQILTMSMMKTSGVMPVFTVTEMEAVENTKPVVPSSILGVVFDKENALLN